jgi:hypothetical protein
MERMEKQTAVEWLVEQLEQHHVKIDIENTVVFEQAKEMEKNNYICSKCKCSLDGKDMQQMQDKENT